MKDKKLGFDTLMIHAGQEPDRETMSMAAPIYQTTAYAFRSVEHARKLFALEEDGNIYTRMMNPTNDILEKRVASLEEGVGALALSSGHAAISLSMLNIAGCGDEIVSSGNIYGGAINLFAVSFKKLGINVKLVNPDDIKNFEKAITPKTKAVFVEAVGNPNANIVDFEGIAKIAHDNGIPFIVDSTFTTPFLFKPKQFGADIIIHSATKFLGGHGSSMAGIVVDCGTFNWKGNERFPEFNVPDPSYHGVVYADTGNNAFITKLRVQMLRDYGPCIAPFNAFLVLQGIETLSLRMKKHCENALKVAKFLESCPDVKVVNYPALESNKYYGLAKKYMPNGVGAVFTFELNGGRQRGAKFIENLQIFKNVANVGDVRSLVIHPASTTHSQLTDEQLKAAGISGGNIRLSIGIEDSDDLIYDLKRAIEKSAE